MSTPSMQCLIPGSPCTVDDVDRLGKAICSAIAASKADTRWILVSACNHALGLVSLADNIPAIGPLTPDLKGCRKAATKEEAMEWMKRCHTAGTLVMVPMRLVDWQHSMAHYLATLYAAVSALSAKPSAADVVKDALAKASGQTKH